MSIKQTKRVGDNRTSEVQILNTPVLHEELAKAKNSSFIIIH